MKRIIFEVLLVLGLGGAGAFGFFTFQKEKASATQLAELTEQTEGSGKKLEELTAELEQAQKEVLPLKSKALQLEALREALVNGETLRDLEAVYKKEKTLSPERLAGLGALRLPPESAIFPIKVKVAHGLSLNSRPVRRHVDAAPLQGKVYPLPRAVLCPAPQRALRVKPRIQGLLRIGEHLHSLLRQKIPVSGS
jgi:hypothetical protein